MSLQKPPAPDRPSRILGRFLVLVILLILVGVAVWSSVTEQRIELIETTSLESIDRAETSDVDGLSINVVEGTGGPVPVVLLHDFDVAGSLLLSPVADQVDGRFYPVRVDLPGFGLSERIPVPGRLHTVAAMAEIMAGVIRERYDIPVVVAGVGLGGEVAAEIAVTHSEVIRGLVMIDTDFWEESDWVGIAETLPYVGTAVVHNFEASGRYGLDRWAPRCDGGGWCPTADQIAARDRAASIVDTTSSLSAFLETPESSLVPAELDAISVPSAYVWSADGVVPRESVDMIISRMSGVSVIEAGVWRAHLESPGSVIEAIELVGG